MNKNMFSNKLIIDLVNCKKKAFYLLGKAMVLSDILGYDEKAILEEMKSVDDENLIEVFKKYFGAHVALKES